MAYGDDGFLIIECNETNYSLQSRDMIVQLLRSVSEALKEVNQNGEDH
jgi:hypothetical protein